MHNLGVKLGWVVNATPWSLNPCDRYLVPIVQEAGLCPGQVWTGTNNMKSLTITYVRTPNHPGCSMSLRQLGYTSSYTVSNMLAIGAP